MVYFSLQSPGIKLVNSCLHWASASAFIISLVTLTIKFVTRPSTQTSKSINLSSYIWLWLWLWVRSLKHDGQNIWFESKAGKPTWKIAKKAPSWIFSVAPAISRASSSAILMSRWILTWTTILIRIQTMLSMLYLGGQVKLVHVVVDLWEDVLQAQTLQSFQLVHLAGRETNSIYDTFLIQQYYYL